MTERILYFAFGHNTNLDAFWTRCPRAMRLGRGKCLDHRIVFRHYLDMVPSHGDHVWGLLWGLPVKEIPQLDHDEHFQDGYVRAEVEVQFKGEIYKAMTYVMQPGHEPTHSIQPHYVDLVRRGYNQNRIPQYQLTKALNRAKMKG